MARTKSARNLGIAHKTLKRKRVRLTRRVTHAPLEAVSGKAKNLTSRTVSLNTITTYDGPTICKFRINSRIVASGKSDEDLYVV